MMLDILGKIDFTEPLTRFQGNMDEYQEVYDYFREDAERDWQRYIQSHPRKKELLNSHEGGGGQHIQGFMQVKLHHYPLPWYMENIHQSCIDFWGNRQYGLRNYKKKSKWWTLFDKILDVIYFWDRLGLM